MKLFIIATASIVVQYFIILYQARAGGDMERSLPGAATPGSEVDGPDSSQEKKE